MKKDAVMIRTIIAAIAIVLMVLGTVLPTVSARGALDEDFELFDDDEITENGELTVGDFENISVVECMKIIKEVNREEAEADHIPVDGIVNGVEIAMFVLLGLALLLTVFKKPIWALLSGFFASLPALAFSVSLIVAKVETAEQYGEEVYNIGIGLILLAVGFVALFVGEIALKVAVRRAKKAAQAQ